MSIPDSNPVDSYQGVLFQTLPTSAYYKNIEVRTTLTHTVEFGNLLFLHLLQLHMSVEKSKMHRYLKKQDV